MNIIVCNDTRTDPFHDEEGDSVRDIGARREEINLDRVLIQRLRRDGHQVVLFDGYRADGVTKYDTAEPAAGALADLIAQHEVMGMVFDLHYFKDFSYGITMLKHLRKSQSIPRGMRLIIFSRFFREPEGDYPSKLVNECGVPLENVVDRNNHDIDTIVERFKV
ncbi:MAG: hypothetical protein ACXWJB_12845 [Limisphaerales bacterium]